MHEDEHAAGNDEHRAGLVGRWSLRGAVALLLIAAAATIWFTNAWLTTRFFECLRVCKVLWNGFMLGCQKYEF